MNDFEKLLFNKIDLLIIALEHCFNVTLADFEKTKNNYIVQLAEAE